MNCGPRDCGQCSYCEDGACKSDSAGCDCRCGYKCPGCMQCNFAGNCLIKNCPQPEAGPDNSAKCEPDCKTIWICDESGDGCVTEERCGELPSECEECDCSCNDDCPDCTLCSSSGVCEPDSECENYDPCCSPQQQARNQRCATYCREFICYIDEDDGKEECFVKRDTDCGGFQNAGQQTSGFDKWTFGTACRGPSYTLVSPNIGAYSKFIGGPFTNCSKCFNYDAGDPNGGG